MEINSIDPAPSSITRPTFLVDWMVTKYCNLNCSYCGPYDHDNHSPHPEFEKTKKTIDFIYEYVDLYMTYKRGWQKGLVLNVYGGESLIHPDIVNILREIKHRHKVYEDKWPLTVQITTNAVIGSNTLDKVLAYVDDWTVSFHSESLPKQRELALKNVKTIHDSGKAVRCIIMMNPMAWDICMAAVEYCKLHGIRYTAKALDTDGPYSTNPNKDLYSYNDEQMSFIKNQWVDSKSTTTAGKQLLVDKVEATGQTIARDQGRACCGGRSMCVNQDFKNRVSAVPLSTFTDWYCSVNWYFLHINQQTGEIYNNKDCRTSLFNKVEPVGNLNDTASIVVQHREWLEQGTMPVIKCIKPTCNCGICAPKARDITTFKSVMRNHWTEDRCIDGAILDFPKQ